MSSLSHADAALVAGLIAKTNETIAKVTPGTLLHVFLISTVWELQDMAPAIPLALAPAV